jgi:hypothetical protein
VPRSLSAQLALSVWLFGTTLFCGLMTVPRLFSYRVSTCRVHQVDDLVSALVALQVAPRSRLAAPEAGCVAIAQRLFVLLHRGCCTIAQGAVVVFALKIVIFARTTSRVQSVQTAFIHFSRTQHFQVLACIRSGANDNSPRKG